MMMRLVGRLGAGTHLPHRDPANASRAARREDERGSDRVQTWLDWPYREAPRFRRQLLAARSRENLAEP